MLTKLARPALLLALVLAGAARADDAKFYLKDGDRVVFYGDSITDQRLYTTFVETYAVTRFPKWTVTFVHSGWGGDRVTGGGGGPIDLRLERDVFAYNPTVVTVMLGMNDASYQPFKEPIFETYAKGYRHLVESIKEHAPRARITLIIPSPFDDVTRPPAFEGGYNAVLVRYGEYLKELAQKEGVDVADENAPVVAALKKAYETDPEQSKKISPDRVHPGPAGHLLMAAALLKDWKAPALVSSVEINAGRAEDARAENAKVSDLVARDALTWTQQDEALPMPINLKDPVVALAVRSSDVMKDLDQQTLTVKGLAAAEYTLKIDGQEVGTFSKDDLARGVNLTEHPTPMMAQAAEVHALTVRHNELHFARWRQLQVPFQKVDSPHLKRALDEIDALEADLVQQQRQAAQPKPHKFELAPKG